jgi:hypothetical protein
MSIIIGPDGSGGSAVSASRLSFALPHRPQALVDSDERSSHAARLLARALKPTRTASLRPAI